MQMWKPKMTWKRLIALISLALLFIKTITSWFLPDLVISQKLSVVAITIVVIQLLSELPSTLRLYSRNRREGITLTKQLCALFPKSLVALFRLECGQQRAFLSWILRKRIIIKAIDGEIFLYNQKSQYGTFLTILCLLCMTDIPVSTLMLSLAVDDSLVRIYLHVFVIVTTLYTVTWLIADRHAVSSTYHIAGTNSLHLRVGERFYAQIPWIACERALPLVQNKELKDSKNDWLRKQGFSAAETIFCTPYDQPNVALFITESNSTYIEKYKFERTKVRYILVYVDEPSKFIHSIHRHIQNLKSEYLLSQLPTESTH